VSDNRSFSELATDFIKIINDNKKFNSLATAICLLLSILSLYNLYDFITIYGSSRTYIIIINDIANTKTEYIYQYVIPLCIFIFITATLADDRWINNSFQKILKELETAYKEKT